MTGLEDSQTGREVEIRHMDASAFPKLDVGHVALRHVACSKELESSRESHACRPTLKFVLETDICTIVMGESREVDDGGRE